MQRQHLRPELAFRYPLRTEVEVEDIDMDQLPDDPTEVEDVEDGETTDEYSIDDFEIYDEPFYPDWIKVCSP